MDDIANQSKSRLLERKKELEDQDDLTAQARATVALDQQSVGRLSRMDALQHQAMAQATERQRRVELARIEVALRAIDADEYGACVRCGEEISPARLEIDPAAMVCINCAKP